MKTTAANLTPPQSQGGLSLIELMIGLTISTFVLLAATTALISTSSTSSTTSDLAQLQQQGNNAIRIIGNQLRQAAALNVQTVNSKYFIDTTTYQGYNNTSNSIQGTEGANDSLSTSYAEQADSRNCLGGAGDGSGHIDSTFSVTANALNCTGLVNGAMTTDTIAEGVESFQVRYGILNGTTIQYFNAPVAWASVSAIEVCIQLRSSLANYPALGTYTNCQGVVTPNDGRLRKIFRNTFLIRNQS